MKLPIFVAAFAIPFAVHAAPPGNAAFKDCSMKAMKITPKATLLKQATVTESEARSIALGTAGAGAIVTKGGIETEDGCLIYSYHIKDRGKSGQTEVFIDAGNGNVLKQEQEGAMRSALEKPVDKTKEVAARVKENVTGEPSTSHNKP
jgi:Peptidase propeptide and YPEB domain